jgi:hypothetical protein
MPAARSLGMRRLTRKLTGCLKALTKIKAMNKENSKSFIIHKNFSASRKKTVKTIVLDEISTFEVVIYVYYITLSQEQA